MSRVEMEEGLEPIYPKLQPRRNGMQRGEVEANQRRRLCGAVVEAVSRHGVEGVTADELRVLAGVSKRVLYERFGSVEGCVLAACERVFMRLNERLAEAVPPGTFELAQTMQLALGGIAWVVANRPKSARLILVDGLDAGAKAVAVIDEGWEQMLELLGASVASHEELAGTPGLVMQGIVAGLAHVARAHVLRGTQEQMAAGAGELAAWVRACCAGPRQEDCIGVCTARRIGADRTPARDIRERENGWLADVAAIILAEQGRDAVRVSAIESRASLRRGTLRREYRDLKQVVLAGYGLRCEALLEQTLDGSRWPQAAVNSTNRLIAQLVGNRQLAEVCLGGVRHMGSAGVAAHTEVLERYAQALAGEEARPGAVPPPALSAAVGALWGIASFMHRHDRIEGLPKVHKTLERVLLAAGTVTQAH